jgi:hypothetical protein
MASNDKNFKVKLGVSTPKVEYTKDNNTISSEILDGITPATLSFSGSAGQLFSISDDLTGTIFSVNDISGIPSIEVNADGTVSLAEFSGNVGVGISNPSNKLHVYNDVGSAGVAAKIGTNHGALTIGSTTTSVLATTEGAIPLALGTNATERVRITNSGEVGIGTDSPSSKLDVEGSIRARTIANATGDFVTASATGVLQKRTAAQTLTDVGAAPLSHTHGNITNAGAIGSTADLVVTTTASGVLTTSSRSGIDSRATFPPAAHTHTASEISDSTTVGRSMLTVANPTAIRFVRVNADNTVSLLTDADFRTAIGAGTGSGTVTSVAAGNGLDFTTITGSGSVTLGTPSTITGATTNSVTTTSHTHALSLAALTAGTGLSSAGTYDGSTARTLSIDSTVATLTGAQVLTNKTLTDSTTLFQDEADNTKKLAFQLSGITTATTRTLTIPNASGTIALTSDLPTVNNGTLTLAVSGTGLSGSASFTANQSGNSTFTVTSNATSANTVSTIVARDGSGNFTAGTITAALSGNATTATTASATTAAVTFNNGGTGDASGTTFNGSTARTISYNTIGAPSSSSVVTLTGNQTIAGDKTFSNAIIVGSQSLQYPTSETVFIGGQTNNWHSILPISSSIWHDMFRWSTPTYETSTDGSVWDSATLNRNLFSGKQAQAITVCTTTQRFARWTWTTGMQFNYATWVVLGHTYSSPTPNVRVIFEFWNGSSWVSTHDSTGGRSAAPYFYRLSSMVSDNTQTRLTVENITGATSNVALSTIRLLTSRWGDQGQGREREWPYNWDADRNLITYGTLQVATLSNATGDFVTTTAGGVLQKRTASQTLTDIGAAALSHTHGNITNAGAIGSTSDLVVTTTTAGVLTTSSRSGIDSRTTFPPAAHTHTASEISDSTTVGRSMLTVANPTAIRFVRVNADNTVSLLTDADFRTAIGAGTGSGTVTSVAAGNGMSFTTITGSGSVTLGTPGSITGASTNAATAGSHTHAIALDALTAGTGLSSAGTYTGNTARTFSVDNTVVALLGTSQVYTTSNTFRAANAIRSEAAATQDAIVLAGRAGGTTSLAVTLVPTTLTASRTLTLPNATGTVALTSDIPTVNDGTLTLAVSGTGLSGSASFTANQAGGSTFTVTSNATSANTVSTIVARDASGNFTAGTITAALTGTATNATNVNMTNRVTNESGHIPFISTTATGNQPMYTNTGIRVNPSTAAISATSFIGALTGNASTATALATPRAINGVNFDGSAPITVPINTTNRTTNESGHLVFIGTTATGDVSAYTNTSLRVNPSTAAISATTFIGALTGNASTATTLQNARLINGTSFNGSGDITITANTTNALTAGDGLTSGGTFNGGVARTFAVGTPTTLTGATTNSVSGTTHSHAVTLALGDLTNVSTVGASTGNAIVYNGSSWAPAAVSGAGVSWTVRTTTYAASANDGVLANTSGGAWTLTLPSSPTVGDTVTIIDTHNSFTNNNLTVARNGQKIQGIAENLTCDVNNSAFELVFTGTTDGWKIKTFTGSNGATSQIIFGTEAPPSPTGYANGTVYYKYVN